MKRSIYILSALFILTLVVLFSNEVEAQCAMCKATAEQGDQRGLNIGIMFLFLMPYTIVATVGFLWWKNKRKEDEIGTWDSSKLN